MTDSLTIERIRRAASAAPAERQSADALDQMTRLQVRNDELSDQVRRLEARLAKYETVEATVDVRPR